MKKRSFLICARPGKLFLWGVALRKEHLCPKWPGKLLRRTFALRALSAQKSETRNKGNPQRAVGERTPSLFGLGRSRCKSAVCMRELPKRASAARAGASGEVRPRPALLDGCRDALAYPVEGHSRDVVEGELKIFDF